MVKGSVVSERNHQKGVTVAWIVSAKAVELEFDGKRSKSATSFKRRRCMGLKLTFELRALVSSTLEEFMRTLSILMAAVAALFLSSTFTATQAAPEAGVTGATPRLGTMHLYLTAKKKHWKSYGYHCPPGQATK